VPADGKS
jgi:hypothetical protein